MADIERRGSLIYLKVAGKWYHYDERKDYLGEGAMGTVYMGHLNGTREIVAIKQVKDKYANVPSIRERAKLEASLQFAHPNLIEMRGYCELNPYRGPLYILSNFISGTEIDKYIQHSIPNSTPDRAKKICQLFYPVLDALSYIHSKNIVHMDIKPSNIMVENGRNVRLMDLGIAHVGNTLDEFGGSSLMGTPKYAAPEQFDVNTESKLEPQTDIYEAGVTLYELLCGHNPFTANTIEDSIKKHKTIILPYTDKVPRKLVDVLRIATNANQSCRYKTANEFKNAIVQALIPDDNKKWILPVVIGIVCVIVIAIIILLIM